MRKLTGYIGAMIIVFALAGSVLAGYALNINGQSAVVNEYETVTDVSGLYSYSDEKNYIDYNPASNYTNYNYTSVYNNANNNSYYKEINNNVTISITVYGSVIIGSKVLAAQSAELFVFDYGLIRANNNGGTGVVWRGYDNNGNLSALTLTQTATVTINNDNLTININGTVFNYTSINKKIVKSDSTDYDYYRYQVNVAGSDIECYYNTRDQIMTIGTIASPNQVMATIGTTTTNFNTGAAGTLTWPYTETLIDYNVYKSDNLRIGSYVINGRTYTPEITFIPKEVIAENFGINYVESGRVNNYPVVNENANTVTNTEKINLTNISASDVWPPNTSMLDAKKTWFIVTKYSGWPNLLFTAPYYSNTYDTSDDRTKLHEYRLSDVLSTYSIPSNARTLKITCDSNDIRNYNGTGYNINIDSNMTAFAYLPDQTILVTENDQAGQKDYIIYDLDNNTCTIYDYNGVSKYTTTPNNIGVVFCDNTLDYGHYTIIYSDSTVRGNYYMPNRPAPFINITSTVYNPADIDYLDITKGFSIKSSNVDNVTWNNEYENGNIQILFRAADIAQTFHNELTISNNTVSVDYTGSRFYITLNGGETVDIGTWRNIVLNIDLVNGKLSVIPVRTFNSFTNVQLDKTEITIGDLVGAAPTSTISWASTSNSLMFNIYSTSVFMDTYGVVMVNPTLDITDYFTNLDNFYKLKLTNFSIYGDSITVNGETYQIDGNKLIVGNDSLIIKDLSIIYADNHAYLEDSHISIDIGEITNNSISLAGAWYFQTELLKGYTAQKMVYDWDWTGFIFDNTEFCIIYIGLAIAGLLIARRYCTLSMIDYAVFLVSLIIALGVQVIA